MKNTVNFSNFVQKVCLLYYWKKGILTPKKVAKNGQKVYFCFIPPWRTVFIPSPSIYEERGEYSWIRHVAKAFILPLPEYGGGKI